MLLTLLALQCFVTGATAMNGSLASQGSFASPDALDDDVMNGSDVSPIRDNATVPKVYERQLMPLPKLKWISGPVPRHRGPHDRDADRHLDGVDHTWNDVATRCSAGRYCPPTTEVGTRIQHILQSVDSGLDVVEHLVRC